METYVCTEAFEVTTHGASHMIEEIHVNAPTAVMQSLFSRLESEQNKFYKGLMLFQKELNSFGIESDESDAKPSAQEEEEDENQKIENFITQMKMSAFDPSNCYMILKDIICFKKNPSKIVSANGEFEIESGHWDKIPMTEVRRLLGFYVINFIGSLG